MKLIAFLFAFLASAALATQPANSAWYNGTLPTYQPKILENAPFSILVADVKLLTTDTAYSQVYDLYKTPLVVYDSLGQVARLDTTTGLPSAIVSCYDVSDSAALVDSVIVTTTVQEAQFAADGTNPNLPFSAAWDSVTAVTLAKPSDVNVLVNGVGRPTLKTREHRYFRFRLANLSATTGAALKNVPRCRVIWQMRARLK